MVVGGRRRDRGRRWQIYLCTSIAGHTHHFRQQIVNVDAPPGPTKGFRSDIQGLRALAVGLVILDHAHVPFVGGGFVGVDVFFVISGFLITGLLLKDAATNRQVRFSRFYARRCARILPAATTVILVTALASLVILNFVRARSVLVDSVWSVLFAANYHFAQAGTNYFASSLVSPLQHYWSLSVEEQFYVVWPAILGLVAFGPRLWHRHRVQADESSTTLPVRRIILVLAGLGAGSLLFSIHETSVNPTGAYFSTVARVWELVTGSLLALALPALRRLPERMRAVSSWVGLGAILSAALLFTSKTPFPGYAALLPVLGAAAVLAGGIDSPRTGAHRLLSLGPFRFVGDISYSLYLWHWPILILGAAAIGTTMTLVERVLLVALAVLVSTASYYGIERPIHLSRAMIRHRYRTLTMWPAAVASIALVVTVAYTASPFAAAIGAKNASLTPTNAVIAAVRAAQAGVAVPSATAPSLTAAAGDSEQIGDCSAYLHVTSRLCQFGDATGAKTMVVFGNSHSAMWIPALSIIAKADEWRFTPVVKEACGYDQYVNLTKMHLGPKNQCRLWFEWASAQVKRIHPDVLVIGVYAFRYWEAGLQSVIAKLKPFAGRVVLISDAPGLPQVAADCLMTSGATQRSCLFLESQSPAPTNAYRVVGALARRDGASWIDVQSWFCSRGLCPSVINGIIPYWNKRHMTKTYSRYLAPTLAPLLHLNG